jgi:hypothetical protein
MVQEGRIKNQKSKILQRWGSSWNHDYHESVEGSNFQTLQAPIFMKKRES